MNNSKTLADKYLKDGVDVEEFIRDITDNIGIVVTTSDITKPVRISIYADDFKKFLNTPVKPILTEDEKVILKKLRYEEGAYEFTKIGRTALDAKGGCDLILIEVDNDIAWFGEYGHLFQFIQPRRRI